MFSGPVRVYRRPSSSLFHALLIADLWPITVSAVPSLTAARKAENPCLTKENYSAMFKAHGFPRLGGAKIFTRFPPTAILSAIRYILHAGIKSNVSIRGIYCNEGGIRHESTIRPNPLPKRFPRRPGGSYCRKVHAALDRAYQPDGAQQEGPVRSEIMEQRLSVPATEGRFLYGRNHYAKSRYLLPPLGRGQEQAVRNGRQQQYPESKVHAAAICHRARLGSIQPLQR